MLLSTRPLETNFSEIRIKIQNFSFMKMHLKMSSAKWRPFCPGEGELIPVIWFAIGHTGYWMHNTAKTLLIMVCENASLGGGGIWLVALAKSSIDETMKRKNCKRIYWCVLNLSLWVRPSILQWCTFYILMLWILKAPVIIYFVAVSGFAFYITRCSLRKPCDIVLREFFFELGKLVVTSLVINIS